jgi:ABC-type transport system involved in multi-copper enzyme maturation permease subunit
MTNVWTIARATYGEITARPFYFVTLAVFSLLIFSSSFLTQFSFNMEPQMVREMGMASLVLWGFLITVLLTGVIVTQELEDRTAVTLLTKPVRRSAFLLGKYFGLVLSLIAGLVILAGVLFYTLWWMAKGYLMGHPVLSSILLWTSLAGFGGGVILLIVGARRARIQEARTSGRAPRRTLWAGKGILAVSAVCFLVGVELSRGGFSDGDVGWWAFRKQQQADVWIYLSAFMRESGTVVLEGLVLSILQVSVLAAVCVALSAFLPIVISVSGTALLYVLGHLVAPMQASLERLDLPAVTWAGRLVGLAIPNLGLLNLQVHFSEGTMVGPGYLALAALHSAIYATVVFLVACSLFERREIR